MNVPPSQSAHTRSDETVASDRWPEPAGQLVVTLRHEVSLVAVVYVKPGLQGWQTRSTIVVPALKTLVPAKQSDHAEHASVLPPRLYRPKTHGWQARLEVGVGVALSSKPGLHPFGGVTAMQFGRFGLVEYVPAAQPTQIRSAFGGRLAASAPTSMRLPAGQAASG